MSDYHVIFLFRFKLIPTAPRSLEWTEWFLFTNLTPSKLNFTNLLLSKLNFHLFSLQLYLFNLLVVITKLKQLLEKTRVQFSVEYLSHYLLLGRGLSLDYIHITNLFLAKRGDFKKIFSQSVKVKVKKLNIDDILAHCCWHYVFDILIYD